MFYKVSVRASQERNAQTKGVRREQYFILKKYLLQLLFYCCKFPYMNIKNVEKG